MRLFLDNQPLNTRQLCCIDQDTGDRFCIGDDVYMIDRFDNDVNMTIRITNFNSEPSGRVYYISGNLYDNGILTTITGGNTVGAIVSITKIGQSGGTKKKSTKKLTKKSTKKTTKKLTKKTTKKSTKKTTKKLTKKSTKKTTKKH
jgi:hypothetical protein